MKLIDLTESKKQLAKEKRKKAKAKNASDIKTKGLDGSDYYKFQVTYQFKNHNWTFEFWAKSRKEAEQRLSNIKRFPCDVSMILYEERT